MRLTENYLIDEKGDTLISEQYKWQNGRLVQMVENGMVRKYIYGKSLADTIRVIPSDYGVRSHSGYDGSTGKIPDENDSRYIFFAMDPYRYTYYEEGSLSEINSNTRKSVLSKFTGGSVSPSPCVRIDILLPTPECIRYKYTAVDFANFEERFVYPKIGKEYAYGEAGTEVSPFFRCDCIGGKYHLKYNDRPINEYIQIIQTMWRYSPLEDTWNEFCWYQEGLQQTYEHEAVHIRNGREVAARLYPKHFKKTLFNTEDECKKSAVEQFFRLKREWNVWYQREREHQNKNPKSPTRSGRKDYFLCPGQLNR
jgi:hypothetical protein